MRAIRYWIQRADFSTTDYEPVELPDGLRAFENHDWDEELALESQLTANGEDFCPPGIGFLDQVGCILHICPTSDGHALVHYHFTEKRKIFGLIPVGRLAARSKRGIHHTQIKDLIQFFFEQKHEWLLEKLATAGDGVTEGSHRQFKHPMEPGSKE